jgi:acyl carrier protein
MNREIHGIITQLFPGARKVRLGDHDDLLETGVVDSVGVLDLVAHLETAFQITIVDEDLVPDNFRSVASLAAFVQAKRATVAGTSS